MNPPISPLPSPDWQSPYEAGLPLPQPAAGQNSGMPLGGGQAAIPHFLGFSQIANWAARAYRWTFDEALRHNHQNALAIRRDPVVMDALRSRQLPTAQLPWHLEAEDDQDLEQAEAVTELTRVIERIPHLQRYKMHLLEATWFGRYAVQNVFGWDFTGGKKRLVVRNYFPVNGDKLVFRYSGEVGVLVHANFKGDFQTTERGRAHFLTPEERETFVVHTHEPEDADFFEPELAGAVQGVGIRSRIYWFWWLRSQVTAFLMDYLERVGAGGFTIYFYEAGNTSSLSEVKQAAEEQHRNNVILFPRYRDGSTGGPGIQRIEPSNAGAQLLQALISNYFDNVIRRYILGQNLTSETAGTGLGSGVADLHADTFARLVKYDAVGLAETLTQDLVRVLQRHSEYSHLPPIKFVFDVDKPNARDTLEAAKAFFDMGGAVDEDELRSIIGLARPQPGHAILAQMGGMQPMGMPTGTPMIGPPGPLDLGQDPQGLSGMGGPMLMRRRGLPVRYAHRPVWQPSPREGKVWLYDHEKEFLHGLLSHRDPDVREMAREYLNTGSTEALVMLHDALVDSGEVDSPNTDAILDMLATPLRHTEPTELRHQAGLPLAQHMRQPTLDAMPMAIILGYDQRPYQEAMRTANRQLVGEFMASPHSEAGVQRTKDLHRRLGLEQFRKKAKPVRYGRQLEADPHILEQVREYLAQRGLPDYRGDTPYYPVNEATSRAIADWYDRAPHRPFDPQVASSYAHLLGETEDQFRFLHDQAGIQFEPWKRPGQPYRNSRDMKDDARSGHLYYFLGGEFPQDNHMAQDSGIEIAGHPHTYNDLFRAVHDYFGHALYGNEFGPRGEEHAWRTHSRMYSPRARPALSMETRGQNSWVNFGPHLRRPDGSVPKREDPDYVNPSRRPYAEQKNNTLPARFVKFYNEKT